MSPTAPLLVPIDGTAPASTPLSSGTKFPKWFALILGWARGHSLSPS